jgi:hypothetical protein
VTKWLDRTWQIARPAVALEYVAALPRITVAIAASLST